MDSHPAYREKIQARKTVVGVPDAAVSGSPQNNHAPLR